MRFKFDRFVIDGGRRIMWHGDEEVHVAPKTLDFLLSLLAQAPNAVSKTELMATLWARYPHRRGDADRRGRGRS